MGITDNVYESFIGETVEGFTVPDCSESFVLSSLVVSNLTKKTPDEVEIIFASLPRRFQENIRMFLTDSFMEEIIVQN